MKPKLLRLCSVPLAAFVLSFASCSKFDWKDYIDPNKTPDVCQIKRVLSNWETEGRPRIWIFTYNHRGDPISIKQDSVFGGRPDMFFLYDHQKRLTDVVAPYQNNSFEFWHKYVWEGKRIVRDTARVFGQIVNGKPVPDPFYERLTVVHRYEYDSYDRIVKWTYAFRTIDTSFITVLTEFTYNAAGNLQRKKVTYLEFNSSTEEVYNTYDNKAHFRRTNKIWMFIDKNYSVNNREPALEYNHYGFPVKYGVGAFGDHNFLTVISLFDASIKYDCR